MSKRGSLAPRGDFPALKEYVYLNSASISIIPEPVLKAKGEYERAISAVGTVSLDEEAESKAFDGPRQAAGELLGTHPDNVAIITSATEGLCQLAWGLQPGRGQNVVSIDLEFPSVTYPWMRVARDTGAEIRLARAIPDPAALSLDTVARLVDRNTAVLCVSHVQYATGHRFDLKSLADLAHAHGALCIIDATQSAGVVPIDVKASGIDALVTSGYKWLCGPFGAAILYVRPELRDRLAPPIVGWRSTENQFNFDATELIFARDARKFESGTMNYPSGFGLGEVVRYLLDLGIDNALDHALRLAALLREGLERLGAEILTPAEDDRRSGIVTARFPGCNGEAVAADLNRRRVIVSPRFGSTRFSPHVFNDETDVERALAAVRTVLGA
ncbi:MAG: aminotransferase class V-fold PLP-dependent enzyme [bacterium]|nr:aminotransferase class V-fold PLP-dependent enzyme [bacterium]